MAEAALVQERSKRQKTEIASVPAISLAPFFSGSEDGKALVAKEWDEACREVGFIKVRQPCSRRRSPPSSDTHVPRTLRARSLTMACPRR